MQEVGRSACGVAAMGMTRKADCLQVRRLGDPLLDTYYSLLPAPYALRPTPHPLLPCCLLPISCLRASAARDRGPLLPGSPTPARLTIPAGEAISGRQAEAGRWRQVVEADPPGELAARAAVEDK